MGHLLLYPQSFPQLTISIHPPTMLNGKSSFLSIKEHPERERVPKGFAADFHLHLERVDDGNSKPMLSVVTAGLLALGLNGDSCFEKSRDLITECVAAQNGQLLPEFPPNLLVYFNQIGRSLHYDEKMELPGLNGKKAILTPIDENIWC